MERQDFEFRVAGREVVAKLGECACVMFRTMQEVDYLAIDMPEDEGTLRVYNNVELVRWMAGIALREDGTPYMVTADDELFRDSYGWNPAVIIKEKPNTYELDRYVEVNTRDLDGGVE